MDLWSISFPLPLSPFPVYRKLYSVQQLHEESAKSTDENSPRHFTLVVLRKATFQTHFRRRTTDPALPWWLCDVMADRSVRWAIRRTPGSVDVQNRRVRTSVDVVYRVAIRRLLSCQTCGCLACESGLNRGTQLRTASSRIPQGWKQEADVQGSQSP